MIDSKSGIIGLAIGDAMGVPLEFCNREDLMQNITMEMKESNIDGIPKGSWSDDTSMTLATIDAIVSDNCINCNKIANNFVQWVKNAKYTPSNKTFDIGRTCLRSILRFEAKEDVAQNCGGKSEMDNGNGSMMRILPLVYYCYSRKMTENEIYKVVREVSSITHGHEISIMGCFIYVMFGIELLKGKDKKIAYEYIKSINYEIYFNENTVSRYSRIIDNKINEYVIDEIKSTGFIIDTLEATLWVLLNTNSYNQAIIGAINLGDDADTVGACVGGLAGICYGLETINQLWKNDLQKYDYINNLCDKFNMVLNKTKII